MAQTWVGLSVPRLVPRWGRPSAILLGQLMGLLLAKSSELPLAMRLVRPKALQLGFQLDFDSPREHCKPIDNGTGGWVSKRVNEQASDVMT